MRGLKTQEGSKFEVFFALVQQEAAKRNSVFFLDCGEGNDFEADDIEGEDLRGWVIPEGKADQFEQLWLNGEPGDDWTDYIEWAEWKCDPQSLTIKLVTY